MKFTISIALCFFVALAQAGKDMNVRNILRGMSKKCAKQLGASPDVFEAMINNKEEMTKEGKCLQACVMKQFKMMTEAGELNVSGVKEMAVKFTKNDKENVNKVEKYAKECGNAKGDKDDECVAAYKYTQCITKNVKANAV